MLSKKETFIDGSKKTILHYFCISMLIKASIYNYTYVLVRLFTVIL